MTPRLQRTITPLLAFSLSETKQEQEDALTDPQANPVIVDTNNVMPLNERAGIKLILVNATHDFAEPFPKIETFIVVSGRKSPCSGEICKA